MSLAFVGFLNFLDVSTSILKSQVPDVKAKHVGKSSPRALAQVLINNRVHVLEWNSIIATLRLEMNQIATRETVKPHVTSKRTQNPQALTAHRFRRSLCDITDLWFGTYNRITP